MDDIEKDWKEGDEKDELEDEFERQQRISQKMKGGVNFNDPNEVPYYLYYHVLFFIIIIYFIVLLDKESFL